MEEKEETPVEHCSWWLGCWGNEVVYLPFVAGELEFHTVLNTQKLDLQSNTQREETGCLNYGEAKSLFPLSFLFFHVSKPYLQNHCVYSGVFGTERICTHAHRENRIR